MLWKSVILGSGTLAQDCKDPNVVHRSCCPQFADGIPCSCRDGYNPYYGSAELKELEWDPITGYRGECIPLVCTELDVKQIKRATTKSKLPYWRKYNERITFQCDPGYFVGDPNALGFDRKLNGDKTFDLICHSNGNFTETPTCIPICGDGLIVSTDHLDIYNRLDECDDGNFADRDGCSTGCTIEDGFICNRDEENPTLPDMCEVAPAFAYLELTSQVTGRKIESKEAKEALHWSLAGAFTIPRRDIDMRTTNMRLKIRRKDNETEPIHIQSIVSGFDVKIAQPEKFSLKEVEDGIKYNELKFRETVFIFLMNTTINDTAIEVQLVTPPKFMGDVEKGYVRDFDWSSYVVENIYVVFFLLLYILMVFVLTPFIYYNRILLRRRRTIPGNYYRVQEDYKEGWTRPLRKCLSIREWFVFIFCCPARVAYTWDSTGLHSYGDGIWIIFKCWLTSFFGCCLIGIFTMSQRRSNMADFFGFGDQKEGNVEYFDYLAWCLVPCAVFQEGDQVDGAIATMAPKETKLEKISKTTVPTTFVFGKSASMKEKPKDASDRV